MLAAPLSGTIKRASRTHNSVELATIQSTLDRDGLWEALTPQLFRREVLVDAYARWRGWPITDDASLVERAGGEVKLVQSSSSNIKITRADDLRLAEALLASSPH